MKIEKNKLRLYAITDRRYLQPGETMADAVRTLLRAGVTCLQLREKELNDSDFLAEAKSMKQLCDEYCVPLIINDRPDIAKEVKTAGVHVGLSDMGISQAREYLGEDYIIGGSAHNVREALEAQDAGADYIGCGAVFGSTTKTDASVLDHEELKAICRAVQIPAVAIGGINLNNVQKLNGTGISGVAVIGALLGADDKPAAVRSFLEQTACLQQEVSVQNRNSRCTYEN